MKAIFVSVVYLFILVSCVGSDAVGPGTFSTDRYIVCAKNDPVKELGWLNDLVTFQTTAPKPGFGAPVPFKIMAYRYKGSTVIENECGFHSSPYLHVYSCDGSRSLEQGEYNTYQKKRQKVRVLYDFNPW